MPTRKRAPADLTGIRERGTRFQVRIFGGIDSATGKQLVLTGSAATEAEAIALRDGFRKQIAEHTAVRTNLTLRVLLAEWLAGHQVEPSTRASYALLIDKFILPALGDQTLPALAKLGPRPYEKLYAELRTCRRRCRGKPFTEHRTSRPHDCDDRCAPHTCRPLTASSTRQIHAVLSSAYSAAVRWGWVAFNPMDAAQKPRPPAPDPDPPTSEDAARIVAAAWAEDPDWGLLIWTYLVTGARRGEVLALRWEHLDFTTGVLTIRHSVSEQRGGATTIKGTKTHRSRRISLDAETMALLIQHRERVTARCIDIDSAFDDQRFIFSYTPDHTGPCSPSGVTHRYARMVEKLGIRTHLHAMRHYSATELLAAGVDLRTVAGRLGHGSGGATTLKVYAAWVARADQQASELLAARLPVPRPTTGNPPAGR
jgi:integrase